MIHILYVQKFTLVITFSVTLSEVSPYLQPFLINIFLQEEHRLCVYSSEINIF